MQEPRPHLFKQPDHSRQPRENRNLDFANSGYLAHQVKKIPEAGVFSAEDVPLARPPLAHREEMTLDDIVDEDIIAQMLSPA